jgi:hypothetical protein
VLDDEGLSHQVDADDGVPQRILKEDFVEVVQREDQKVSASIVYVE